MSSAANPPSAPPKQVWPCLNYADARAGIRFLTEVLGFDQVEVYTDDDNPEVVVHAELRWPEGGGVMLGSAGRTESEFSRMPTGAASVYVVTDDSDAVWKRCQAAGARVVRGMREEDYGSRGFSVADAEGNIWSFGTYRGAG